MTRTVAGCHAPPNFSFPPRGMQFREIQGLPRDDRDIMKRRADTAQLRQAFLEIVDTQLRDGMPPETGKAFRRLVDAGHSPQDAKRLLSVVVGHEVLQVMATQQPFNHARFVEALDQLPDLSAE